MKKMNVTCLILTHEKTCWDPLLTITILSLHGGKTIKLKLKIEFFEDLIFAYSYFAKYFFRANNFSQNFTLIRNVLPPPMICNVIL